MICKNCGKDVQPRMSQTQLIILIVLCILGIIPGIVYFFLCNKTTCPICGKDVYHKVGSDSAVKAVESKEEKPVKAAKAGEEK
jgi:uncharacterized membrane protein